MSTRLQQIAVVLLLGSALMLVSGCGRDKESSSGGSEAAPKVTVAMDAIPTMPAAQFSAPTTMITPESAKVEATAEVTATVEVSSTTPLSTTSEVTGTSVVTETSAVSVTGTVTK
jgi:hypothetical protein